MKQDMIVILDLGSHHNTNIARCIRDLGVYSEIKAHDITVEELKQLPNVKGIVLSGGPNNIIDGKEIDIASEIYNAGYPIISFEHKLAQVDNRTYPANEEELKDILSDFVFNDCHAQKNWNMKNFINDQVEIIRKQVGDKKVLLALSGGVDSSVVAALLIKAIGNQLTCVHVNHGLMRKGESENVVEVFKNQLHANLVYVDASERFLNKLAGVDAVSYTHLDVYKRQADYIMTGEGSIDSQTVHGKTISGIAKIALKYSIPVIAFGGRVTEDAQNLYDIGVTALFSITNEVKTLSKALVDGKKYLEITANNIYLSLIHI